MKIEDLWDAVYRYGTDGLAEETVDDVLRVIEKQIPKPPEYKVHEKYPSLGKDYYCQECGVLFASWEDENGRTNYCGNCGQKLRGE